MNRTLANFHRGFASCRALIPPDVWLSIIAPDCTFESPDTFFEGVRHYALHDDGAPDFLADLARLEWQMQKSSTIELAVGDHHQRIINPSLAVLDLHWTSLADYLTHPETVQPKPGEELVLVWQYPLTGKSLAQAAANRDLLVLKSIAEGINAKVLAEMSGVALSNIYDAFDDAARKGLILVPPSQIRRNSVAIEMNGWKNDFNESSSFTLQLHITQDCDLHCRHCYDRNRRLALSLPQAAKILDDLETFCNVKNVRGHISFTGGNPLLHPDLPAMYRAASERGFTLALLGNPAERKQIEALHAIQPLDFFQVSLEGLPEYNDYIRGKGHFERTMVFLDALRDMNIYSMVMLTITRDNLGQVIPLGRFLQGKTDAFFFNRLTQVGEGAALALPSMIDYESFLDQYLDAAQELTVLCLKDNLLNIAMARRGMDLFGGCTGFGCGAAFNFLAVLSDGEVHACRKFPSLLGNISTQDLGNIYDSEPARRYRDGCSQCNGCTLKPVCGGCLGSAYSHNLDIFSQKDPFCYRTERNL